MTDTETDIKFTTLWVRTAERDGANAVQKRHVLRSQSDVLAGLLKLYAICHRKLVDKAFRPPYAAPRITAA